ncbi:MAG: type II toxin-antitoxin system RelE/ParE family toxin [Dehalococcoidia bacterium]|nr:type II toxin-antitoxin system RelE/ParE family toxin [Dehalococcoidia bacterium]
MVFYVEDDGTSPVEEFLTSLDAKTQRRFRWSLLQLWIRNVTAREPLARHLEGKLWELREESSTNIYRVIYFFFAGRQIVLLHGFQKKTQKTPRQEIDVAGKRMERFARRERR